MVLPMQLLLLPFFLTSFCRYVRLVFDEELEPKVINGRAITAPELKTYFETYVKMFQADNKAFPKVNNGDTGGDVFVWMCLCV